MRSWGVAGSVGGRGRLLLLPLLLLLLPLPLVNGRKKIDVFVAGFFPLGEGPKHSLGRGVMPALTLAVKHVNDHPTVLRNYKLHVIWNDTQCDTAVGTKLFFDMMYREPTKLMLFGAACTHVTNPIAKAAKHWHIVQLSYADTHPMFNAIKYPNFFRMAPSDKEFNHPRLHLLQKFNWTRVGTLFQNEPRHALAHNHLASMLEENAYEIAVTQNIADELKDQLKQLHQKDVRIILGYFDEHWARRIFCEAYRKGMYGKNYQWIITGMYREEWWALRGRGDDDDERDKPAVYEDEWKEGGGGGCAVEDIMKALEGCIMTDLLPLSTSLDRTVSGKNISEYEREYNNLRRSEYSRFHGYTYDGVWAMALAIQAVGHKLRKMNHENKTNLTVQDFHYRNPVWEDLFTDALSEVKFEGVTGPVQFSSDNTRNGYILLKQFQGGREVKIGEYDGFQKVLELDKGHPIYWPGGYPPLDRTVKLIEKTSVNISIYAILVTIASMGIVMASIFLAINIKYRNQRYIKMSSPYLNNVIIVGCILTYTSVILLGLDSELTSETSFPYICTARAWVLMAGFTLAFGSMFSKTWRVHSIFTDVQLNKKVIKDSQLFLVVLVLLCVDVAIMTTWQVVDPFYRETKHMTPYMRGDILVIPENEYCKSSKISVFIGCIYAYKGLLMVFGCFLAWETRQVNIPALNDSKYIGMSVYNVVIMCVIGAPISYILSDEQDSSYLIISIFILFCTTGTLCLVFVPKIIELRRNPQGNIDKRLVRPTLRPPKSQDSDSELSDLHEQIKKAEGDRQVFKRRLHEREQELQVLIEQLGEDALGEVEAHGVTRGRRPSKPRSVDRLRIEGPSVTETTECTELTSLCSAISHDTEYITSRLSLRQHHHHHQITSTTTTTTSTITPHLLHHHLPPSTTAPPPQYQSLPPPSSASSSSSTVPPHLHHQHQPPPPPLHYLQHGSGHLPPPSSTSASTTYAPPPLRHDICDSRRGVTFASPVQTPREVSKSVSFRLEGGGGGQESIPLHPLTAPLPPQPTGPSPPPPQAQLPPVSHSQIVNPYQEAPPEPGVVSSGYGGVYVHDYGGAMMAQEQRVLQQRRASRGSLAGRRFSREGSDAGPPLEPAPQPPALMEYAPAPTQVDMGPMGGRARPPVEPYRRTSLRRGVGVAAEEPRVAQVTAGGQMVQGEPPPGHPDPHPALPAPYNISTDGPPPYRAAPPPREAARRGSEPPRPLGRGAGQARNRSCDDLACDCGEGEAGVMLGGEEGPRWEGDDGRGGRWEADGRWEGGEGAPRTISRAHLRRDSFGEVVSRRSPSQDSLDHPTLPPASPTLTLDDPTPLATPTPPPHGHAASTGRRSPSQDSYGYGAPPRRTPSQDSLEQQVCGRGRAASQESLGTMSSRGSVCGSLYSVTSARSDQVSRCSSKETVRNHAPLTQQTLPHPRSHAHSNYMADPPSLHRTISEPYNFDDDDDSTSPHHLHHHQFLHHHHHHHHHHHNDTTATTSPPPPPTHHHHHQHHHTTTAAPTTTTTALTNNRRHPPVRTPSYDNYDIPTLSGFHTHSLRGRGRHATTTSVAAAIAAVRRNASDNALDHDTSILPIFQKLLSERQRGYHGGSREFTMSSCPNITIKCDIVEYL